MVSDGNSHIINFLMEDVLFNKGRIRHESGCSSRGEVQTEQQRLCVSEEVFKCAKECIQVEGSKCKILER